MFDSFFASKKIIKWLNRKGFTWFTRLKRNRKVQIAKNNAQLQKLGLNYDESVICKLNDIKGEVKILRFCHQDEEYFIGSNNINLTSEELKVGYLKRWQVEVFHREAKQKLGLDYLMMQSWNKLTNHVGLVCLAYSLMTVLGQLSGGSVGDVKFKLADEALGISSALDIIDANLAA
ncbi:MAG: transposase [bacterium]